MLEKNKSTIFDKIRGTEFFLKEREPFHSIEEEKTAFIEYIGSVNWNQKSIWKTKTDRTSGTKKEYLNIPLTFDIETSSWDDDEAQHTGHHSCMYCFVFGINGRCFLGRTWNDFKFYYDKIVKNVINAKNERRVIIFVHNLEYEFQFIRKRLHWSKVFAVDSRTPLKAVTVDGIEFRCSYLLSGYSLAKVGDNLIKYRVKKMVGDLDYHLRRNSSTPLTDKEWQYVIHDGLVVMAFIQEEIERNKGITHIPLTNTGYVRKYCRKMVSYDKLGNKRSASNYQKYRALMNRLTLDKDEYEDLRMAFQGGFTHARAGWVGERVKDVTSFDFTSSYPAVMVMEEYPMSESWIEHPDSREQFYHLLEQYCCLFTITFFDLEYNNIGDVPISESKCYHSDSDIQLTDNGRVRKAKRLTVTITDVDFEIYRKFYNWSKFQIIGNMRCYMRGYLPTTFISAILHLYRNKTSLKGVAGKEIEYMHSKSMLNATFGMCVTSIIRNENVYDDEACEWTSEPCSKPDDVIEKYNTSKSRFLFYPWGVWITAYARRNLFKAIYALDTDYIYADTDSVKLINIKEHQQFFDDYNKNVDKKLKEAMKHHKLPLEWCYPRTIKGDVKALGYFDYDGHMEFKTLGAKRYIKLLDNGELEITISGVSKKCGKDFLEWKYSNNIDDIFDSFDENIEFEAEYKDKDNNLKEGCGKKTRIYLDEEDEGYLTDYLGNTEYYHELSSIYMIPTSYSLSMTNAYINLIKGIKEKITDE